MADLIDYTTLRFVDKVGANYLFRGGSPVYNQSTYDYDGLIATMKNWVGIWPERFYLVVISLFDDSGDARELAVEREFFDANPDLGQLVWWPIAGTPDCYFWFYPEDRAERLRTLDDWLEHIVTRTDMMREWLDYPHTLPRPAPDGIPCAFYVHCDGGCDRTAEIIGAYRLRYQGWSWLNVWSEQPCMRRPAPSGSGVLLPSPLGCNNHRALQWYAFWLNWALGFNLTGIGEWDGGCTDPGGVHQPCTPWSSAKR